MRAVTVTQPGGPEVLEIRDVPISEPGQGQVRVRVFDFGLNRADYCTGPPPGAFILSAAVRREPSPRACGLERHKLVPASASERQIRRVLVV